MRVPTSAAMGLPDRDGPPAGGSVLLDNTQAPPSIGLPSPAKVRAVQVIRCMRGASQPWLLRCNDDHCYVVKFRNNPQHARILANEMLACRLAQLIGLPVAAPAFVEVPPELVDADPPLEFTVGNRRERCAAGLHFGSRYPGALERTAVVDFLPDSLLRRVEDLAPLFLGAFVFDKWTCNCDGRQVVFFRRLDAAHPAYSGLLIDQGLCFNGGEWNFPDSPIRSLYPRRLVYDTVAGIESFEPFLSRIETLRPPIVEECIADIPNEWCSPEPGHLKPLVSKLYARRRKVAHLIIDSNASSRPFRNWV
ncbi:MAG: HipA family kinase [Terriglobia bacterium]